MQNMDSLKQLSDEFEHQFHCGWQSAGQLVLTYRGETIFELALGSTGHRTSLPVTSTTPFMVCSIGKTLIALCVHHLVDTKKIQLDDKISIYWPEFYSHGKELCTIRHVLLHQAGLPKHGLFQQLCPSETWDKTIMRLEKAKPDYKPGTKTAYHPLNYGFILGELVRRVSGHLPQSYLAKHFLEPMGLTITSWTPADSFIDESPLIKHTHVSQMIPACIFNRRYIRKKMNPSLNLHSTAKELATIFEMIINEGIYKGICYLSPKVISEATAMGFRGLDWSIGRETLWALGFHLGGLKKEHSIRPGPAMGIQSSVRTFGHCGHMSSIVWADPDKKLVCAFTCNGLMDSEGAALRWQRIADLAWKVADQLAE